MKPPKYVTVGKGGTAMRLASKKPLTYYRDAGMWDLRAVQEKGKFFVNADYAHIVHLNGMQLFPITRKEWAKGNVGYVPDDKA
jgi:hypothetical protein